MTENKTIAKFNFDLENNSCTWLKDNNKEFIIPQEWSGVGRHQERWFQIEGESNKAHWVNYKQVYSQGKVRLKIWYKKDQQGQRNDYSLQAEKDANKLMVTITEADEMTKAFDEKKGRDVWTKMVKK
jgi:hypothetical protein